jgi:hypothetical protein
MIALKTNTLGLPQQANDDRNAKTNLAGEIEISLVQED